MMVEVFSTNIGDRALADRLLAQIHRRFRGYVANFDLDDCDRILRVRTADGRIDVRRLIDFLQTFGCIAKVLPDELPTPPASIGMRH